MSTHTHKPTKISITNKTYLSYLPLAIFETMVEHVRHTILWNIDHTHTHRPTKINAAESRWDRRRTSPTCRSHTSSRRRRWWSTCVCLFSYCLSYITRLYKESQLNNQTTNTTNKTYLSYLPLAHIFETMVEHVCLFLYIIYAISYCVSYILHDSTMNLSSTTKQQRDFFCPPSLDEPLLFFNVRASSTAAERSDSVLATITDLFFLVMHYKGVWSTGPGTSIL